MLDINNRMNIIVGYIGEILDLGQESLDNIKSALALIKEVAPNDAPNLMNRINKLISASDDISWIILGVKQVRIELESKIREIKAPEYTMLVRQNRPSTQAIEMEIVFKHDEIKKMSDDLTTMNNLIDYLNSVLQNIDKMVWSLRDRVNFVK